uniref:Uncharacterized protein n=1 Tax=Arundo donax TaxID=35708 RepID=A0A0A9I2W6_ARUDO
MTLSCSRTNLLYKICPPNIVTIHNNYSADFCSYQHCGIVHDCTITKWLTSKLILFPSQI